MKFLTRQEEFVLLAVHFLKEEANLKKIRKHLISLTGKSWSVSSVYVPLDRLAEVGYLDTYQSEPQSKPGGKARRHYRLSLTGMEALAGLRHLSRKMWANLEDTAFEGSR